MRIQVKGRNGMTVDDELVARARKKLEKVTRQVSPLAELELECREERNPAIRDSQIVEATLHLKGVTLRACERSEDLGPLDEPGRRRPGAPGQEAPRQAPPPARDSARPPAARRLSRALSPSS